MPRSEPAGVRALRRLPRSPGALLLHISLLLIIVAGAIAWGCSRRGTLLLAPDTPALPSWMPSGAAITLPLPRPMRLDSLAVTRGSDGSVTGVTTWLDLGDGASASLSPNSPLQIGRHRFYQSSWREEGATVLAVNYDPAYTFELTYLAYILFLAGFVMAMTDRRGRFRRLAGALMVYRDTGRSPGLLQRLTIIIAATALGGEAALFVIRWASWGTVPLAGGGEAMAVTSMIMLAASVMLARRAITVGATVTDAGGLAAAAVSWLAAPSLSTGRPLAPVLDSPWLAIHVTLMMTSYALLAIIFLISLGAIWTPSHKSRLLTLALTYPALLLLGAGIITGSVWAGEAWGRLWAWDPKETWALITFLVYSIPLHSGMGPRRLAIFMTCAFLTVLMTWFGVNYLPSLHAYQ